MNRNRKVVAAVFILSVGVLLALPFRLDPPKSRNPSLESPLVRSTESLVANVERQVPRGTPGRVNRTDASPVAHQVIGADGKQLVGSFDLVEHPSVAEVNQRLKTVPSEVHEPFQGARPVYRTASGDAPSDAVGTAWPTGTAHVVRNGDTLEKLAQRYLGDGDRGLEIFDLNRDLLSNPHLLPIGIELRIPIEPNGDIN